MYLYDKRDYNNLKSLNNFSFSLLNIYILSMTTHLWKLDTIILPVTFFLSKILIYYMCWNSLCIGSKAWTLVAGIRVRTTSWVLASKHVQSLEEPCKHGAIWRRNCEHSFKGLPHWHPNGEWQFCWRRV